MDIFGHQNSGGGPADGAVDDAQELGLGPHYEYVRSENILGKLYRKINDENICGDDAGSASWPRSSPQDDSAFWHQLCGYLLARAQRIGPVVWCYQSKRARELYNASVHTKQSLVLCRANTEYRADRVRLADIAEPYKRSPSAVLSTPFGHSVSRRYLLELFSTKQVRKPIANATGR
jgi:hypothetical protein